MKIYINGPQKIFDCSLEEFKEFCRTETPFWHYPLEPELDNIIKKNNIKVKYVKVYRLDESRIYFFFIEPFDGYTVILKTFEAIIDTRGVFHIHERETPTYKHGVYIPEPNCKDDRLFFSDVDYIDILDYSQSNYLTQLKKEALPNKGVRILDLGDCRQLQDISAIKNLIIEDMLIIRNSLKIRDLSVLPKGDYKLDINALFNNFKTLPKDFTGQIVDEWLKTEVFSTPFGVRLESALKSEQIPESYKEIIQKYPNLVDNPLYALIYNSIEGHVYLEDFESRLNQFNSYGIDNDLISTLTQKLL